MFKQLFLTLAQRLEERLTVNGLYAATLEVVVAAVKRAAQLLEEAGQKAGSRQEWLPHKAAESRRSL